MTNEDYTLTIWIDGRMVRLTGQDATDYLAFQISVHKTRAVFERYNIVSQSGMKAAVDRMSNRQKTVRVEHEIEESEQSRQATSVRLN